MSLTTIGPVTPATRSMLAQLNVSLPDGGSGFLEVHAQGRLVAVLSALDASPVWVRDRLKVQRSVWLQLHRSVRQVDRMLTDAGIPPATLAAAGMEA